MQLSGPFQRANMLWKCLPTRSAPALLTGVGGAAHFVTSPLMVRAFFQAVPVLRSEDSGMRAYEFDQEESVAIAKANDLPICAECGWGSDDEFDLCCDCFDAHTFKQMLRGEFGRDEQQEARAADRSTK